MTSLRSAFLILLASSPALAALKDRCGDCWCVPVDEGSCPTDESGIVDSFDTSSQCVLSTFELTDRPSFLELQSSDGQACYPYTESLGVLPNSPQTELPPCVVPVSTNSSVCAYKYNPSNTTCAGRQYQVLTYDSEEEATADSAVVTHTGACGVCSSAHDFWVRIRDLDALEPNSIVCATSYTLSGKSDRFETLIQCFEEMGFSTPCATLWAHHSAASTVQCGTVCLPDGTGFTKLNEDPPTCEFAPCLACTQTFQGDFDAIAGRTLYNSGITERIIRPCDVFSRVDHDPCVGTKEVGEFSCDGSTTAPAPSPTGTSTDGSGANAPCSLSLALLILSITTVMHCWIGV